MASIAGGGRNWAELPPELLSRIAEHLDALEYICFSAVCTSWASAPPPLARPPQAPYLLLPGDAGEDSDNCTLLSLTHNRTHRLSSLPDLRGKWFIGSQDGWLVLLDRFSNPSLFNPLTRAHIRLPSIATLPTVNPVYGPDGSISEYLCDDTDSDSEEVVSYSLQEFRDGFSITKLIFSPNPTAASYTAVAMHDSGTLLFCSSADEKWTNVEEAYEVVADDAIYRDGKFLVLSNMGEVYAVDAGASSGRIEFPMLADGFGSGCDRRYLIDSSGELLQACRTVPSSEDGSELQTSKIEIRRLEPETNTWVAVMSLADCAMFLGTCYSMLLSARDVPGIKSNCVYFTDDFWDVMGDGGDEGRELVRDVGVYNLEDASVELCFPRKTPFNWPPPTWILPALV